MAAAEEITQLSQVDLRGDELIVASYSRTTPGFWVMNGTFVRLAKDVSDDKLGATLERALSISQRGLAAPSPTGPSTGAPLLKELGFESYSAYAKGVRSVQVARTSSHVAVVPTRNEGSRRGFVELVDEENGYRIQRKRS
jgi:hypothetical protein